MKTDSTAAKQLFDGSASQYAKLSAQLKDPTAVTGRAGGQYLPYVDSLKTSLSFLQDFKDGVYGYYSNAKFANGAVINALRGGEDYSNGAVMWDGWDLAQLGMKQRKPANSGISISSEMAKSWENYWKNVPGQKKYWTKHFNPISSSPSYSYIATAQQGGTIFWKIADNPAKRSKADYYRFSRNK